MVLMDIVGVAFANNPATTKLIVEVSLFLAAAVWGISTMLPAGWLTLGRTILLAVIVFGGVVGAAWLRIWQ
jgi:hypothetical protein